MKNDCELCSEIATEDWVCHIHLSDETRIDYVTDNQFILNTPNGILVFTSDTCIKCGRNLREVIYD